MYKKLVNFNFHQPQALNPILNIKQRAISYILNSSLAPYFI
jgi:hypothetical protein